MSGVEFSLHDAENLMESYVQTLRSGDVEAIKGFWSRQSLKRKGFEIMHLWVRGTMAIDEWKDFLARNPYPFEINELSKEDDFHVIVGEWVERDTASAQEEPAVHPMQFYVVEEEGRWVLINPIDVLTKDWHHHETTHLVFFYPSHISIEQHLPELQQLDRDCATICAALDLSLDEKIEYYKASSPEQCGELLVQPPANGYAAITFDDTTRWFHLAVSTTFYNPHEVMHVLSKLAGLPYINAAFTEGLAVGFGGTTFQTAEYAHVYSKHAMNEPYYIPLRRLFLMEDAEFLRKSFVTYQEAGSFIRFLIDKHGIEKLRGFMSAPGLHRDFDAQVRQTYGLSLGLLEKQWHDFLSTVGGLDVGSQAQADAKVVFKMNDPAHDDTGDGDYKYPGSRRFVNGCFDLRSFEVAKDDSHVFFKIGLQEVIEPVVHEVTGEKFAPGVVIAINRGSEKKRHVFRYTNEVRFEDDLGYDLKITAGFGACLSNNFGKILTSSKTDYNTVADANMRSLSFALPIELVGDPQPDWRYFVGIGFTSDRMMTFGGLIPVPRDNPGLIHGGKCEHGNPAFIDILLPEEKNQAKLLRDYDCDSGKLVTVPMLSFNTKSRGL